MSAFGPSGAAVIGVDGSGRTWRATALAQLPGGPVVTIPARCDAATAARLLDVEATVTVLFDDAHRHDDDVVLAVTRALDRGGRVIMSRRPGVPSTALAALESAVLGGRAPLTTEPLTRGEVSSMPAAAERDDLDLVLFRSGGAAWLVAAMLADPPRADPPLADPPTVGPALRAAVERRLADLGPDDRALLTLLAVAQDQATVVEPRSLGALLGVSANHAGLGQRFAAAVGRIRLAGVLPAGWRASERLMLPPAVADVLLGDLSSIDRSVAREALATGRDFLLDSALAAAADGRSDQVVTALGSAGDPGRSVLAVPAMVGLGRTGDARGVLSDLVAGTTGRDPAILLATAVAGIADATPRTTVRHLIAAAEAREATPALDLDSPHALGALVAVAAGDSATAARLLVAAQTGMVGGEHLARRHSLLLDWVRLRSGISHSGISHSEIPHLGGGTDATVAATLTAARPVEGSTASRRDRFVATALAVGRARRSADVLALRTCWDRAGNELARCAVDLFAIELVEELVVAAARLDNHRHARDMMETLQGYAVDAPALWRCSLAWIDLQVAVVDDDAESAESAAELAAVASATASAGPRQRSQAVAARVWAQALAGRVSGDEVIEAVAGLVTDAELPWEAGRLAGQAAVRTTDARVARRLLERARELTSSGPGRPGDAAAGSVLGVGGMSEREIEVATLVLEGRTHREIGVQLYISPKTVEHHVSRIRSKIGARTKAEFVAALQSLVSSNHAP